MAVAQLELVVFFSSKATQTSPPKHYLNHLHVYISQKGEQEFLFSSVKSYVLIPALNALLQGVGCADLHPAI